MADFDFTCFVNSLLLLLLLLFYFLSIITFIIFHAKRTYPINTQLLKSEICIALVQLSKCQNIFQYLYRGNFKNKGHPNQYKIINNKFAMKKWMLTTLKFSFVNRFQFFSALTASAYNFQQIKQVQIKKESTQISKLKVK